ncbi:MAG: glutamate-1-semialdehyde 2,1-aminomutase [Gemmatimonadetes bacterium]|uniref:Glutamate-1-semialdehyde 2,1-aminomutase n=1 Tax=Candidatus Kutchimonas denitrificans TaxID=3056748 RepID=A0AAE4Z6J6_9BACT|nr:glutamate-1-semialdehyde 2,1-aminomutase [Gemmatimonadota bacterium]NIR73933.1 glutamate-1-semialdehyde 2,1-aminomutase [Candidatus Kutchimonas denitrificans]NIR99739.1 glutamate-1-semialdehyde 2,1-aminomutase [Gemmatimonadota bacterium]NIT65324.1 glutamate-1-semialdehyde 2,1-aminomutase [Gemmatimonadota bacterium]NIW73773.1 glutamate-1-semialdehyde 2,1-aminomutase [Gemmatimonadota bacterium]
MNPGKRSHGLYRQAREVTPGGVNSPVRAFGAVGGEPFFTERADGCRLRDVDGREYIDYVLSWGPLILGHGNPQVMEAVAAALERGTHFGTPTPVEVELAEKIVALVPSVEMVRFVNSGTEATMSAIRLARAYTGRDLIVKFEGCYHGHGDSFLASAGSGIATLGIPSTPGVPEPVTRLTLTLPFNDRDAVDEAVKRHGDALAAIIVEPVVGNAGLIAPDDGFLAYLREATERCGALLIFDEVMTGFRVALGGAQARYGVAPDLTALGKVIGAGFPVGAYGGRRDVMSRIAPEGDVYQAGTLSGNPVAMAAGLAQLEILERDDPYSILEERAGRLVEGIVEAARRNDIPATGRAVGSMFGVYFVEGPVRDFQDALGVDRDLFGRYYRECLEGGVFFAPSPFEAGFISTAHGDADIDATLETVDRALARAARHE